MLDTKVRPASHQKRRKMPRTLQMLDYQRGHLRLNFAFTTMSFLIRGRLILRSAVATIFLIIFVQILPGDPSHSERIDRQSDLHGYRGRLMRPRART